MLHLLHPAALWTLAALALPLAIHLRRPPPHAVRLGSLRFLENAARRPLRSLRWRELLLLGTRMGLLAALALLLAEPRWIVPPPTGPRRWMLLDPTAAPVGKSLARWHTARRDGYEPRRLVPGFPTAPDDPAPDSEPDRTAAPDLWSLLREADAELPNGSTLAVFSPSRLAALRGTRPALGHCKVEWVSTPDLATEKRVAREPDEPRTAGFVPAISVLILHDATHAADARYVEAAVRAAAGSTDRRVNLQNREINADVENVPVTDWTFWLCERPSPESLAQRAPRLLRYAGNNSVVDEGWIVAPAGEPADCVRLRKRATPEASGVTWWSDGQGNPLLSYSHPLPGERWDLLTRFDPDWNDLPSTTALPRWMRTLLFSEAARSEVDPTPDRRLADPTQSLPSETAPAAKIERLAAMDQPSRDLHWPLWTLAAVLFAAERLLSLLSRFALSRTEASTLRAEPLAVSR